MAKATLTQQYAERSKTGTKDEFHWDNVIKGFGLKIAVSGRKTWVFQKQVEGGRERRLTLGTFPAMDFETARKRALNNATLIVNGGDPLVEKRKQSDTVTSFAELMEAFHDKDSHKDSYRRNIRGVIDTHLKKAPFWTWRIGDLDQPTFRRWIEENYRLKSGVASNLIQHVRGAYNYGKAFGLTPQGTDNPASAVGRHLSFKLKKSTYAMNMEDRELGDLLKAISEAYNDRDFNPIAVAMVELILHTGARKSEILSLRFDEIDMENRTISKADHKTVTKTNKARIIRLSQEAMNILERAAEARKTVHRENKTWVFPAYRGNGHMADANRTVTAIGEKCGFPTLKPHNLRSLYINIALDSHVPLPIVSANVGHANVDTTLMHYVKNKKSALMSGADTVGIKLAQLSKMAQD